MYKDTVLSYLQKIADNKGEMIDENTDLFEECILESLDIISLLSYLQEEFSISFSAEDMDFKNFQTVEKIVGWLNKKGKEIK